MNKHYNLSAIIFILILNLSTSKLATGQDFRKIETARIVNTYLKDVSLSTDEVKQLKIFHGQWKALNNLTLNEKALIALQRYDLDATSLHSPKTNPIYKAQAYLNQGFPEKVIELLKNKTGAKATYLKAQSYEMLGQYDNASKETKFYLEKELDFDDMSPSDATNIGHLRLMNSYLEGKPAKNYQQVLLLFNNVQLDIDPLYYRASLASAKLLHSKGDYSTAAQELHKILGFNPNDSDTWYALGLLCIDSYQLTQAQIAYQKLLNINPENLLGQLLNAQVLILHKDYINALAGVEKILQKYPSHRQTIALKASIHALMDQPKERDSMIERYNKLSPKSADIYYLIGKMLSKARYYVDSEQFLLRAIAHQPNWSEPRVELGLMLMQKGDEPHAMIQLTDAQKLDPFNIQVNNQLNLLTEMQDYETITTPHFIIKYKLGVDRVLAFDMSLRMEDIYKEITKRFDYEPKRKTIIEILPTQKDFAIRITGSSAIHTVAACTGDVIAIAPPRNSSKTAYGEYNWYDTLKHEYAHTVTLNLTKYKTPHWFTEACAVSVEPNDGYNIKSTQILADKLQSNELFSLDEISWAFIIPKKPGDRHQAYAQGNWFVQYLIFKYGPDSIIKLNRLYRDGAANKEGIQKLTNQSAEEFMIDFKIWAAFQVQSWGLMAHPSSPLIDLITDKNISPTPLAIKQLKKKHADHPIALRFFIEDNLIAKEYKNAQAQLIKLAKQLPFEIWPQKQLLMIADKTDNSELLIKCLHTLNRLERKEPTWADELSRIYVELNDLPKAKLNALDFITRNPYSPKARERIAMIYLKLKDFSMAQQHLKALTLLESDRWQNFHRYAAICMMLKQPKKAKAAAQQALLLNPNAPVNQFLGE